MVCIISGHTFAVKWLTLLYSDELGCGTVLVHGLHQTLKHVSKKSHRHYDAYNPVSGFDLPAKLCGDCRKFSQSNRWEGIPFRNRPVQSGHRTAASLGVDAARSTALTVGGGTTI